MVKDHCRMCILDWIKLQYVPIRASVRNLSGTELMLFKTRQIEMH